MVPCLVPTTVAAVVALWYGVALLITALRPAVATAVAIATGGRRSSMGRDT